MEPQHKKNRENPLRSLMKDNVFEQLSELNLIDANGLRNFVIREKYRKLRSQEFKSKEAMDIIHLEYKNLAYNTIRKIIFRKVLK